MTTSFATLRRVVVGSTNPVKVGAARAVLQRFASEVEVVGHAVPSGVPDQPWGTTGRFAAPSREREAHARWTA